jgi:ABC-type sugar transport system ATPase subunit
MAVEPLIQLRNITKRFPGVLALNDVSVDIAEGSCHALMGENGAGKSTLGKILAGLYTPDSGQIVLGGKTLHVSNPQDAVNAGIGMVHQELLFCENLTVAENLCLGDIPHRSVWVDDRAMVRKAQTYLDAIGAQVNPNQRLGELPISKQQLVQIAAGIGKGARVLIFDEPTSSLSQAEAERLLEIIHDLKRRKVTCIYVSHRLEEVFDVCDTVTVLRDGTLVQTVPIDGLTRDALVRMMIGRDLAESLSEHEEFAQGDEILRVERLSSPGKFSDVSLTIRAGEILGLAGLVGAGRTEVAEALFGLDPEMTGSILVRGKPLRVRGPIQAMGRGLGLIPEDRKRHGLVLSLSAMQNVSLPNLGKVSTPGGWIRVKEERGMAKKFFDRMRVKAPGLDAATAGLSGGNQQKLVLAKWLAADSDVLLIDEPTRGVDVGAKAEIHSLIRSLAKDGKAILLISSELPELLALATRVVVMREGSAVGELAASDATEESVMRLMAGVESVA